MKFKTINGWTKAKMIEQIKKRNNGSMSMFGTSCLYRSEDNNCCFIGCFIPDEKYEREMESNQAHHLLMEFHSIRELMPLPLEGLNQLQDIHDMYDLRIDKTISLHEAAEIWINENVEDGVA